MRASRCPSSKGRIILPALTESRVQSFVLKHFLVDLGINKIISMHKIYMKMLFPLLLLVGSAQLLAQTVISGTVKDGGTQEPIAGVNIIVKGKVVGTITDTQGKYNLKVNQSPPFTLTFSFIGFHTEEKEITDANTTLDLTMNEESLLGQEVVVSASRVEENILKSPVTIEMMDVIAIKQAAAPDFF